MFALKRQKIQVDGHLPTSRFDPPRQETCLFARYEFFKISQKPPHARIDGSPEKMKTLSQTLIDAIWSQIALSKIETHKSQSALKTPDEQNGSFFSIANKSPNDLTVQTSGKARVTIDKEAFRRALEYLIRHNHVSKVQFCEIGACISNPGPLDLTTRTPQSKRSNMVIPYVLPILEAAGVLTIDGGRPNKVWLNL